MEPLSDQGVDGLRGACSLNLHRESEMTGKATDKLIAFPGHEPTGACLGARGQCSDVVGTGGCSVFRYGGGGKPAHL